MQSINGFNETRFQFSVVSISDFLFQKVSVYPLLTFRVLFGLLLAINTIRFIYLGWIEDHFINPSFHFHYYGFDWVQPLPLFWMYATHILLILAALGIMLGIFFRLSTLLVFFLFTYFELIDLTYYLNHYYFVSLVSLLWCIIPCPSLNLKQTPRWTILIFQTQLAIVYLYAGLAKINYDWLIKALPLKIWLPAGDKLPLFGWLFSLQAAPYLFSWMGMLYDCTIVIFLLISKTRPWAYLAVIAFHLLTSMLFQIGAFPYVMIAATLIFFSHAWHEKIWHFILSFLPDYFKSNLGFNEINYNQMQKNLLMVILSIYFIIQISLPWRYLLYNGNVFWTEEGYRFAWRVMLMEKAGTATFYVKDSKTNREGVVNNAEFLNPHQEKQMAMQPDMILQFAHILANHYSKIGVNNPQVRVEVYVTLNGKLSKLLIDPHVNLVKQKEGFGQKKWIAQYD